MSTQTPTKSAPADAKTDAPTTSTTKKPAASKRAPAKSQDASTGASANPNGPSPPDQPSVEEQREEQLKAGKVTGKAKTHAEQLAGGTPAEQRTGVMGTKPIEGRVDNMTRRDDSDVLQGHFCVIDFDDNDHGKAAREAVEAMIGEGNAKRGFGDYGVYIEPGTLDENGYPLTATVMLRDEHSCLVSSVPYGALRPIPGQGGRR
jgi:hypothetical protein